MEKTQVLDKTQKVEMMTELMAKFVSLISYKLPDDVENKLKELSEGEDNPLAKIIYKTMFDNQKLAFELKRPSCQDTGVLQFFVKCGQNFPLIGQLDSILRNCVYQSTKETPLRHNSVETFDEYNTGKNIGNGS